MFISNKRYNEEFKKEAIRQAVDRGYSGAEVAHRLGVTPQSIYAWIKKFGPNAEEHQQQVDVEREIRHL